MSRSQSDADVAGTARNKSRRTRALMWLLLVAVMASKAVLRNTIRSLQSTVLVFLHAFASHLIATLIRSLVALALGVVADEKTVL